MTLDLTSASAPFMAGVNTILLPRSLFLESRLKADFDAGSYSPLGSATLYGEDLAAGEISEGIAGLIATTLTGSQASDVLNRLMRNSTDAQVYEWVDITSQAVVANLPMDVVRILPWVGVANGPTGAMPQDFWEKVGAVATTVVNTLLEAGQLIYDGLVALGTFLVDLGEAIVEWGMQAAGQVSQVVVEAMEKVGEVLGSLLEWAWNFIIATLDAIFGPLVTAILDTLANWGLQLQSAIAGLFSLSGDGTSGVPPADTSTAAASLFRLLSQPTLAFIAIFTSLRAVEAIIAIATGSIIGLQVAKEAISQFLQEYVIYLIFQAFLWGTLALIADMVAGDVDSIVVDAFTEVGFFFGLLAATIEVVKKAAEVKMKSADASPVRRAWAAGLAFTGLFIMLMTDLLGLGTSGLLLLVMDAFGYFLVWYNAIEYRERSKDLENRAIDLPSPISSKFEAITTYGTVGLGAATIGVHAAEGRYW